MVKRRLSGHQPIGGKTRRVDESFCVANSKVSPSENFFLKHALVFGTFPKHAVFIEPLKETANTNKRKAIYVTTSHVLSPYRSHRESNLRVVVSTVASWQESPPFKSSLGSF